VALLSNSCPEAPQLAEFRNALGANAPSEEEYIRLVDESARMLKNGKHAMDPNLAPICERLGLRTAAWAESIKGHRKLFRRVVAPLARLKVLAKESGKSWFQGAEAARLLFA
jgi:hypothetical protein